MANIRIADLPPVPSLANNAIIVLEQNGISYNTSITDLFTGSLPDAAFSNTTVTGTLNVNNLTTLANLNMSNEITMNSTVTGTPSLNASIIVNRGTSTNASLVWNETADNWTFGANDVVAGTFIGNLDGNVNGDVTGTLNGNVVGNVTGDVTGTVSSLANHDTGGLPEGSNLYYTDARANSRILALVTGSYIESLEPKASPVDKVVRTGSRTFGLSDVSTMNSYSGSSQVTWTVPTNSTAGFPVGTYIGILQEGAGAISITGATGVSIVNVDGFYRTAGSGAIAGLYKSEINTWILTGAVQP